jgi:mediator of RNA polymerase II transcription subunit 12
MANCNLAQAAFVARLADEYLDGMLGSRALTKPFADACLGKLVEVGSRTEWLRWINSTFQQIRTTAAQEYLPSLEALLKALLQVRAT